MRAEEGFTTYVMNPHDDGIGIDEYVDWLIGMPVTRSSVEDFGEWVRRFHAGLAALPAQQRHNTVLQMLLIPLHGDHELHAPNRRWGPRPPTGSGLAGPGRQIGVDGDIPHVTREVITRYATDSRCSLL